MAPPFPGETTAPEGGLQPEIVGDLGPPGPERRAGPGSLRGQVAGGKLRWTVQGLGLPMQGRESESCPWGRVERERVTDG